jgi:hypothetical protein
VARHCLALKEIEPRSLSLQPSHCTELCRLPTEETIITKYYNAINAMFNRELRFVERCVSWKAINSYRKIQAQLMQTCNCYDCTKDCKLHNFQSFQSLLKTTSDLSTNSKPKHVESENAPKKVVRYCNSFLFSLSHLHFILQHPRTPLAFQQSPPSIHFLTYQPFFPLQNPNTACSTWNSFLWTFTQTKKKKKSSLSRCLH